MVNAVIHSLRILPEVCLATQTTRDMVKHSVSPMQRFFTRERFGRPQFLAGLLLLAFAVQVVWLIRADLVRADAESQERQRIEQGLRQWAGQGIAGVSLVPGTEDSTTGNSLESSYDTERSPLVYLISSGPLLVWPAHLRTPSWRGSGAGCLICHFLPVVCCWAHRSGMWPADFVPTPADSLRWRCTAFRRA